MPADLKAKPEVEYSAGPGPESGCGGLKKRFLAILLSIGTVFSGSTATSDSPPAPLPRLFPDYVGITLPPNIAPLNFRIEEPGSRYRVALSSTKGEAIVLSSSKPSFQFPAKAWRSLLRANAGQPLLIDIAVQNSPTEWTHFRTITNHIAPQTMDGYLAYRLLKPLYNVYVNVGIYQRNLESFEQKPILENQSFGGGCLNCHTPLNRQPDTFAFNIRGQPTPAQPMVMVVSNQIARVDQTMGYLSWHPSGKLLAFSANRLSLFYHTAGETRDVYDAHSDLGIYRVDSNSVVFPPEISLPNRNETWPAWSADGRYLYYSSAIPSSSEKFRRIKYDLVRASYDLEHDQWGPPETLVNSLDTGLSACQPKISPDGRFLLFTMCAYGNFPIYQSNSDLYLMDLVSRQFHRLNINSDQAESWHSWSSDSHWIVFSSKRIDGLFARPHFAYLDEQGEFHKPFVLPQQDPSFYDSYLKTFNVPEFMQGPVTVRERDLAEAIVKPGKALTPSKNLPPASTGSAPQLAPASGPMRE